MPRKHDEPNLPHTVFEPAMQPTTQESYSLPKAGQQLCQGQTVTYEVGIDETGRHYTFNVRIVDEPSVH